MKPMLIYQGLVVHNNDDPRRSRMPDIDPDATVSISYQGQEMHLTPDVAHNLINMLKESLE